MSFDNFSASDFAAIRSEAAGDACFVAPDEVASVVVADIAKRPRPEAHVIVFANEKGGVGKSTLAFHSCMVLAHQGAEILAIDLDRRQQTLQRALETRDATARALQAPLPRPRHVVLERHSAAQLCQEIAREGQGCDFIVIDIAGHDSPLARRAIAMADTLITPVNNSFTDLDPIGHFGATGQSLGQAGPFASMVRDIRAERVRTGRPDLDWVVVKNRVRGCEQRMQAKVDAALGQLSGEIGFRIATGISERVGYRELLPFGLSHRDIRFIPGVGRLRSRAGDEVGRLVGELGLPEIGRRKAAAQPPQGKLSKAGTQRYCDGLEQHLASKSVLAD